jgi:CheY-like chemotaxis protein
MQPLDLSTLRVLLVEDAPFMRTILRGILVGLGVRNLIEASDGADGLEQARAHRPDIILLDEHMPVLDGMEMLRLIRKPDSFDPYVPIIVMTAEATRAKVLQIRDAGATEIVRKPLSAKVLYERIYNIIKNPRPFVKGKGYFGPDRRRFVHPAYPGEERRLVDLDNPE